MFESKKALGLGLFVLVFALGAQAGPAMFQASLIYHAFGNTVTSGASFPYNFYWFNAMPLGHDCQSYSPYTPNGSPAPRYCTLSVFLNGSPATGPFPGGPTVVSTGGKSPLAVTVPASIVYADHITGFWPTYYPYLQSWTNATFKNEAATFFAGGGPAAGLGTVVKSGKGQTQGTWVIREGARGFGGPMGLLGKLGARNIIVVPGKAGSYVGTITWNMVPALGREQYATPIGYTAMGKTTAWQNPHETADTLTNNVNGNQTIWNFRATATPWTTGSAAVYALGGVGPTISHQAGYDITTAGGARNIQLVTPQLVHIIGPGFSTHAGQIAILNLVITPEPGKLFLLAAGGAILALLYWANERRSKPI